MSEYKSGQVAERVREIVSKYVAKETNGKSIITITTVDLNNHRDHASVFFTVLPESEEKPALDFLKRKRTEIRKTIMKEMPIARIPFIEFFIDKGEKLFRKITEIEMREKNQD
jgi:ribosome-binding factor A